MRSERRNQTLSNNISLNVGGFIFVRIPGSFSHTVNAIGSHPFLLMMVMMSARLQKPNPMSPERGYRPCLNQRLRIQPRTLWNCVRLPFASCTSNLLEQKVRLSPKKHKMPLDVDLESSRRQNLSLEILPVCDVLRCFPHDNTA